MIGIDLFAGAGGMSLGARQAGIDVQVVVESDPWAVKTYQANHIPKYGVFAKDIRKFKMFNLDVRNKPLVVFGGPPCQGFSTSNQKTRNSDNSNNWLFKEFIRVVQGYMPDWVVFENVKGILETEQGKFVEIIIKLFKKLGYSVSFKVLNANEFGVPQKRSRFFLVASLNGEGFDFPEVQTLKPVTVKQAISDLPILINGANQCSMQYSKKSRSSYAKIFRRGQKISKNNIVTRNNEQIIRRYRHIPQGGNWEDIPASLMKNYADRTRCHTGIYRRLIEDEPSVVIGNYRKNMLIHPTQDRGLSVREAARLQSFPDDFVFQGSIGFQQQQVGNAVPPLLAKAVFEKIMEVK